MLPEPSFRRDADATPTVVSDLACQMITEHHVVIGVGRRIGVVIACVCVVRRFRLSVAVAAIPAPEQAVGRVVEKGLRTGEFVLAGTRGVPGASEWMG